MAWPDLSLAKGAGAVRGTAESGRKADGAARLVATSYANKGSQTLGTELELEAGLRDMKVERHEEGRRQVHIPLLWPHSRADRRMPTPLVHLSHRTGAAEESSHGSRTVCS